MEKLLLTAPSRSFQTEIRFENKIFNTHGFAQECLKLGKRAAVIADAAVADKYGEEAKNALEAGGVEAVLIPFKGGEAAKTRETKQTLEDEMMKRGYGRDCLVVGLGGGVATDLAGYLASTYMRGVPLVLAPTSLLAMVDAAIGGKTGVDTPYGKNLIGTFYPANLIWIDPGFLETLPEKEWKNGLAEILKYGLIANPILWEKSKHNLKECVRASVETKVGIVQKDPDEKGLRRVLNFGHTVGHALEHLSNYAMPHGEAVGIGCLAESYLSCRLGYLPEKDLEQILSHYGKLGFKRGVSVKKEAFFKAMAIDKKAKGGTPRFVLIDRIGHAMPFDGEYCRSVSREDLESMADWMGSHG